MEEKNKISQETEYDNGFKPKEVILPDNYVFYKHGCWSRFWQKTFTLFTKFFLFFPKILVWNFKVKGKKNLKGIKKAVWIANHTHQLDCLMIMTRFINKKFYALTLQSNMGFGVVSWYFRVGGAVPIPNNTKQFIKFNKDTVAELKSKSKYNILIYPEAQLVQYCDHIREFKPGAFSFAYAADMVIIPTVMTYHKPKGLYKLTRRKKPCMHYNILEPYHFDTTLNKKDALDKANKDLNKIMSDFFIKNSDYFYNEKGEKI